MKSFKKILATLLAALTVASMSVTAFAEGEDSVPEFDPNGTYAARLGFQAQTEDEKVWVERIGYYHNEDGDKVHQGAYDAEGTTYYEGTFTDAVIEGNGTYTVSYTTTDIASAARFTQLHVTTNIPKNDEVTFSDLIVKVGGAWKGTYSEVIVDDDSYAGDYCVLLAFNHWRKTCNEDTAAFDPLCIPTSGDITIELTFTVSGFAYDKEVPTEAPTEAPTVAPTEAPSSESDNGGIEPWLIAVIVAVVVVVVVVIVVVAKKGKNK